MSFLQVRQSLLNQYLADKDVVIASVLGADSSSVPLARARSFIRLQIRQLGIDATVVVVVGGH